DPARGGHARADDRAAPGRARSARRDPQGRGDSSLTRTRLDPSVFRLPVDRIRSGYYSDAYFNLTRELLRERDEHPRVTMQVFQKHRSILGGIDEAIAVLKLCTDWDALEVHALYEG